jgi:hypothetical protein
MVYENTVRAKGTNDVRTVRGLIIGAVVLVVAAVVVVLVVEFAVPAQPASVPATPTVTVPQNVPPSVTLWPEAQTNVFLPQLARVDDALLRPRHRVPKHLAHLAPRKR